MLKTVILSLSLSLSTLFSFSQDKPNVVLIMVDDMNDWVGAFGGNQQAITPHIDALAEKSIIFKNAYCSAPLCNPSRTSILTGYNPSTTGVYGNSKIFRNIKGFENTITLPQYFNQYGYSTVAAGKIFHSPRGTGQKPKPGSDPGSFEIEQKGGLGSTYPKEDNRFQHGIDYSIYKEGSHFKRSFDWAGVDVKGETTNDWKSADYCAQFLEKEHNKPFFLACGIFRPHLPWYAPQKYFDLYNVDNIELPKTIKTDLDDVGPIGARSVQKKLHRQLVEKKKWKEAVLAYLANLSYADACVGHVVDALNKSKYNKNTIIVLMGDHGWHLGEKEHWTKQTLWEEAAKTPLLIFDPRNKTKGVSTKIVSLIDVYPTLIDLAGLPLKEDLDGQSIAKLVSNPNTEWNELAFTSRGNGNHTLRNENFRYIVYSDDFEELYDHRIDPMEWHNLANDVSQKEVLKMFRKELKKIVK
ncbi:sulfatase [Tamlana sp. 2_MG-2023]|uniref:sulfatase n=1 Tax=unclassified Tamlana TaxID=2614803 RepID=UPI0026E25CC8|nr:MULTISPECIES: sulfatase [unclassified Tamlana]MDO6760973.1 sulfatase [Tamlana sp. 2_MG-2023]MDO6791229.1 sulfatase [Tamlana sp. 1_MG-2023]